jgi:hypothetical protein
MLVLEIFVALLLTFQVARPEAYNAKYSYATDSQGLIRFNTQDGSAVRCTPELNCEPTKSTKEKSE